MGQWREIVFRGLRNWFLDFYFSFLFLFVGVLEGFESWMGVEILAQLWRVGTGNR